MRRRKFLALAAVSLLIFAIIVIRDIDFGRFSQHSMKNLLPWNASGKVPIISFGTRYFGDWNGWMQYVDHWRDGGGQAACGFSCDLVSNRSAADAILFHGRDLEPWLHSLRRSHRQRWIYLNMESPIATQRHGYDVSSDPKYRFMFNWTATTSLTSSIHLPYGSWERRPHQFDGPLYSASKKRYMAFVAFSNCKNSFNSRTEKVAELQKYIEVHVYGECGDKKLDRNATVWSQVSEQYRFYLSFENAFCRDYITEKFHTNGLESKAIPVVFGGLSHKDYELVSPPHSFVYALDFPTMRHLADYLVQLSADEARYSEYFNWKRHYIASSKHSLLCRICTKLHSDIQSSVTDLSEYYDIKRNCRPTDFQYLT